MDILRTFTDVSLADSNSRKFLKSTVEENATVNASLWYVWDCNALDFRGVASLYSQAWAFALLVSYGDWAMREALS